MMGVDSMDGRVGEGHYIQEGKLKLQFMKGEEKQYRRGNDSI